MDLGLKNLNVLVTGGSRGIGLACADLFAAEGASVSICARDAKTVVQAAADLKRYGGQVHGGTCDVSDKAQLEAWVADSADSLGGIDIVVANASALAVGPGETAWQAAFQTDILHSVRLTEAALPHLCASKHGAITFVSSVSAREADGTGPAYGAFKLALQRYAKDLAVTLAPDGIRANTIAPGTTYFDGGVWQMIEQTQPEMFAQTLAANPLGRMATADEIARAIVFISSPASSFTSGANLTVDGAITRSVQL